MNWLRRQLHRLDDDERGTTITEFVLTLPIFIVIFIGIVEIGMMNAHSIVVESRAYRMMWTYAVPITKTPVVPIHMAPASGGATALAEMGMIHTRTGLQEAFVTGAEIGTYGLLTTNGTWGESRARAFIADPFFEFGAGLEGRVVLNPSTSIIGDSDYVKDLYNESIDFSGSGGGALGALNAILSGAGIRPAIAAGARYGMAVGYWQDQKTVARITTDFRAHFTTLVAPYPMGGNTNELITTAVTRLTMESHGPYSDLPGIAYSQPLPGESLNVPDLANETPPLWVP